MPLARSCVRVVAIIGALGCTPPAIRPLRGQELGVAALTPPSCYEEAAQGTPPSDRWISEQGVRIPTGYITLVRWLHDTVAVGVFRPDEQEYGANGRFEHVFIRYVWWFQPNGDRTFRNRATRSGYGETEETYPTTGHVLQLGPMSVQWSGGNPGFGWVYFKLPWGPARPIYEFGLTCAVDLHRVDWNAIRWVNANTIATSAGSSGQLRGPERRARRER
jgi:hypothetical protein